MKDSEIFIQDVPPFVPDAERLRNSDVYEVAKKWAKMMWDIGLEEGRNESPLFVVLPVSVLENKNLSANAKLLYAEIMALSKKSGTCYATNKHLGQKLGLSERTIPSLLKELKGLGMIQIWLDRSEYGTYRDISVLYFHDEGARLGTMGGNAKERGQKRNIQNRNKQIDSISNASVAGVPQVFKVFEPINPSIKRMYGNKTQRASAENLIKQFGLDNVLKAARAAVEANGQRFAPRISTPYQLETKWADLIAFYKEHRTKSEDKVML